MDINCSSSKEQANSSAQRKSRSRAFFKHGGMKNLLVKKLLKRGKKPEAGGIRTPSDLAGPDESSALLELEESSAHVKLDVSFWRDVENLTKERLQVILAWIDQEIDKVESTSSSSKGKAQDIAPVDVTMAIGAADKFLNQVGNFLDKTRPTTLNSLAKESNRVLLETLRHAGNIHWALAGLSMVAFILERVKNTKKNKKDCLVLLRDMGKLAEHIVNAYEIADQDRSVKEAIQVIQESAIWCIEYTEWRSWERFFFQGTISDGLKNLLERIKGIYGPLTILTLRHVEVKMDKIGGKVDSIEGKVYNMGGKVDNITDTVSRLQPQPPPRVDLPLDVPRDTVGLEERVKTVLQLLGAEDPNKMLQDDEVRVVVLHGIGGIGKSTLGKVVCQKLFDCMSHSHVEIGENPTNMHICECQKNIIKDMTEKEVNVGIDPSRGRQSLQKYLEEWKTPICLFLDNIFEGEDLEKLLPTNLAWPKGSKVVITSRDAYTSIQQIFSESKGIRCESYPVEELSKVEAEKLFRMLIDGTDPLPPNSEHLIGQFLKFCGGLPLALEVVGKHLKCFPELWEDALESLKRFVPLNGTKKDKLSSVVRFSYERLHPECRETFLDIACLFREGDWNNMERYFGKSQMSTLQRNGIVKREVRSYEKVVQMHDLFVSLAHDIDAGTRVLIFRDSEWRKWFQDRQTQDACGPSIQGLCIYHASIEAKELDALMASPSLRILCLHSVKIKGKCSKYPARLQILRLIRSTPPFQDMDRLTALKICDLHGSESLIFCSSSPNLQDVTRHTSIIRSFPPNLKRLRISGGIFQGPPLILQGTFLKELGIFWSELDKLPETGQKLEQLRVLEIYGNEGLEMESLPESWGLTRLPQTLKVIDLSYNRKLRRLCDSVPRGSALESLRLGKCESLEDLPEDFGNCTHLQLLNLEGCKSLEDLSEDFGNCTHLQRLNLWGCSRMRGLPQSVLKLKRLEQVDVRWCSFQDCDLLDQLQEELPSLKIERTPFWRFESSATSREQEICKDLELHLKRIAISLHILQYYKRAQSVA